MCRNFEATTLCSISKNNLLFVGHLTGSKIIDENLSIVSRCDIFVILLFAVKNYDFTSIFLINTIDGMADGRPR